MNAKNAREFEEALSHFLIGRVCVLGIGNRLWRDDGVGSIVAEALQDAPGLTSVDGGMVPENYLEALVSSNPDTVLMIDAADFGGRPGDLRLLAPGEIAGTGLSTHAGSPLLLAQYLEARGITRVGLLAIQPGDTRAGGDLSAEVGTASQCLTRVLGTRLSS